MARSTKFGPDITPGSPTTQEQSPGGFFNEEGSNVSVARSAQANADASREYAEDSRGWAVGNDSEALNDWSATNNSKYYSEQSAGSASAAAGSATAAAASAAEAATIEARVRADSEEIARDVARFDSEFINFVRLDSELRILDSEARIIFVRIDSDAAVAEAAAARADSEATIAAQEAGFARTARDAAATSAANALADARSADSERILAEAAAQSADSERTLAEAAARSADSERVLAQAAANRADSEALISKSWAVGPSGTGEGGTDTNNAHYWSEQARMHAEGDSDTTYNIWWNSATRTLALVPSEGDSETVVIDDSDAGNTTYTAGTGLTLSDTEFSIRNGGVGTTQLQDNAVTVTKLADNSVSTQSLREGAVTAVKIITTGGGGLPNGTSGQHLTSNGAGGFVWVNAPADVNTTYTAGTGLTLSDTEFSISDGGVGNDQIAANAVSPPKLLGLAGDGVENQILASAGSAGFKWVNGGSNPTPVEHASISLDHTEFVVGTTDTDVTVTFNVGSGFDYIGTGNNNGNAGNDTVRTSLGTISHTNLTDRTATLSLTTANLAAAGTVTVSAIIYAREQNDDSEVFHQQVSASIAVRSPWYVLRSSTAPANVAAMVNQGVWTSPKNLTAPSGTDTLYVALPRRDGGYSMSDGDLRLFNPADRPSSAFDTSWSLYSTTEAVAGTTYTIREV